LKRIAFVITGLSTGGAEMMLWKVLERIDRHRFEPHVFSLSTRGTLAPRIAALGVPVVALEMDPAAPSPWRVVRLVRLLRRLQPDMVHTWMYHSDLIGGLAARMAGVRALGWCLRNSSVDRERTKWSTRTVVRICAAVSTWLPSRILSCSEKAREVHVRCGYAPEKMVVVPNGFDLDRFIPDPGARSRLRAELGIESDAPLVGLVGRIDPQKNHLGFLEAARLLHRTMPEVHFVMAGSGVDPSNAALMEVISRSDLLSRTHLLGLRHDIPSLMAALDVLASSSYAEAFPNVLGEAMACGVPCAVTDVGDSAYIVGDTGRVVRDMPGLAAAMQELLQLSGPEKAALGERARARIASKFEIGAVVRQYEDFYESLSAGAR
jgi:glycosyltransferase involved in cell wall biosynthesis